MTFEFVVATALLSLANRGSAPLLSEARAEYLASAVVYAAGQNPTDTAAMLVNLVREGGIAEDVEQCRRHGRGGLGAWQLNPDVTTWRQRFPRGFCGPIGAQAKASITVLHYAWDTDNVARSFGFYIGAKEREHHPDAIARAELYHRTVWELEHQACFF